MLYKFASRIIIDLSRGFQHLDDRVAPETVARNGSHQRDVRAHSVSIRVRVWGRGICDGGSDVLTFVFEQFPAVRSDGHRTTTTNAKSQPHRNGFEVAVSL